MSEWRLILGDIFVLAGAAAMTLAAVGMAGIPDAYGKMHAASKAVVLGVLVILGASIFACGPQIVLRALLVGAFLLLTAPVGSHALARFKFHKGRAANDRQLSDKGLREPGRR